MMVAESPICDSLSNQLEICIQTKFTGRLDVQAVNGQPWSLYLCMGRLLWSCGGSDGLVRWRRLLLKHCRQMQQLSLLVEVQSSQGQGYALLLQWVKQQQITGAQAADLIRSTIAEVLFDILQQEKTGQLTYATDSQDTLNASLTLVHPRQALTQAQQAWAAWKHAGLDHLSPNSAPMLRSIETLEQPASLQINPALAKVIDGKRSLRDLSLILNQDLLLLTRILIAYVRKGLILWVQIPALPSELEVTPSKQTVEATASEQTSSLEQSTSLNQISRRLEPPRLPRRLAEPDEFVDRIEQQVLNLPASQQEDFCNHLKVLLTRLETGVAPTPTLKPSLDTPLEPAFIALCQQKLTYCIGPIASYLIKTSLIEQPEMSAQQLIEALAAKIDNPQEAQAFRDDLLVELKSNF